MSPWFPPRLGRESMCPTSAIGARATSCSFIGRRTFVATLSRRLKRPVSARSPERPESGPTRPCTSVVGCWSTRTSALASRSSLFGIAARTERSGCAGWRILTRRKGGVLLGPSSAVQLLHTGGKCQREFVQRSHTFVRRVPACWLPSHAGVQWLLSPVQARARHGSPGPRKCRTHTRWLLTSGRGGGSQTNLCQSRPL